MKAKWKPIMSIVSKTANWSRTALGSSASDSLGTLGAQSSNSDRTGMEKPVAEATNQTIGAMLSHHNFQISNAGHLEKVYSNVRQKLSRHIGKRHA